MVCQVSGHIVSDSACESQHTPEHLHWYICGAVMEESTDIESISILLPPSVIVGVPTNRSNNQTDQTATSYVIHSPSQVETW